MNVRTLTGSSIQAALADARRQFGTHAVLVESVPATGEEPARVTIMVDEAVSNASPAPPLQKGKRKKEGVPSLVSAEVGSENVAAGPAHAGPSLLNREAAGQGMSEREGAAETNGSFGYALSAARAASRAQEATGRGRLFPAGHDARGRGGASASTTREKLLEAQIERMNDRLDGMERRFGKAALEPSQRWTAHPLFVALRRQGMRTGTLTTLFEELAERGHDPKTSGEEALQWAMAQLLRRRLQQLSQQGRSRKHRTEALALVGPGGAGKTSLLLKLATHRSFYARRKPAIIVIPPEEEHGTAYQNPVAVYRRFGLPVQTVRTEEEMTCALERVEHLGPILVDTPPLPLPLQQARPALRRLECLLDRLLPLEVHFALSATHTLDDIDAGFERLPLAPNAVALTHLDEAPRWGAVAEWLMTLSLPVQFASDSAQVPEGARAFSATWFVEEMMGL